VLIQSTNPTTSRWRFEFRTYGNWIVILALFVGFVGIFSWLCSVMSSGFLGFLVVDVVAISLAVYLKTIWDRRPIKLACGNCEAIILSNTPWVCGVCGEKNTDTDHFPFVHKCKSCGSSQKAYKCHHCDELIFLSEDKAKTNYAYSLNSPDEAPKPDEQVEKLKKLRATKEEKAERLGIAEIDGELIQIRNRLKLQKQKKKTPKELLQEGLDSEMQWEEAEVEITAAIEEKYRGNPAMIKRMKTALKKKVLGRLADDN
jgi:hypothetical protein